MIRRLRSHLFCSFVVLAVASGAIGQPIVFDPGFDLYSITSNIPLDTDGDFVPDTFFPFVGAADIGPPGSDAGMIFQRIAGATLNNNGDSATITSVLTDVSLVNSSPININGTDFTVTVTGPFSPRTINTTIQRTSDTGGMITYDPFTLDLLLNFTPVVGGTSTFDTFSGLYTQVNTATWTTAPPVNDAHDDGAASPAFPSGGLFSVASADLRLSQQPNMASFKLALALFTPPNRRSWDVQVNGAWNDPANWDSNSVPNGPGEFAVFGTSPSPRTIFNDSEIMVDGIEFDSGFSYNIAGTGTINIPGGPIDGSLNVLRGDHQFQVDVSLGGDTDVDIASDSSLTFNNRLNLNNRTLTKTGAGDLIIGNTANTGTGTLIVNEGGVSGSGMLAGDMRVTGGTVLPGGAVAPAGIFTVDGDYDQMDPGLLEIEIGGSTPGTEYDQLIVTGTATLGGTLRVVLLPGVFEPAGTTFDFISAGQIVGGFDTFDLPLAPGGGALFSVTAIGQGTVRLEALQTIPEPATIFSLVLGCLALAGRRSKRCVTTVI